VVKNPLVSVVIPTHNRKEMLIRLIKSIKNNTYKKLEIIVVDDASTDGTFEEVKKNFSDVKIIRNEENLLLAASRNIGINNSKGEYIFLIDDDNVVDKKCIFELIKIIQNDKIGMVAPLTLYWKNKNKIRLFGVKRNMVTSVTRFPYKDKIFSKNIPKFIETKDCPNAFMIKRSVINDIGIFDSKNFPIHYDEADLGERIRSANFKIYYIRDAKVWHNEPLIEEKKFSRNFNVFNEERAYFTSRNRIIFHRKYSKNLKILIFTTFFLPIMTLLYISLILLDRELNLSRKIILAKNYLIGFLDGFKVSL